MAAGIVAGLITFLAALRERQRVWLTAELGHYSKDSSDIAQVIATEMDLGQVFAENSADRVAKALPAALSIADPAARAAAVRQILADEERFAQQRSEAMAARAIASLGRFTLRRDSPLGAFWKLGRAQKHTEQCKFMAGKFWPWAVLDRVHPPRHYGCTATLHGFGEAVASGWMSARDVPDPREAIRAASGVVMEAVDAEQLLAELDVRVLLVDGGVHESVLVGIPFRGAR